VATKGEEIVNSVRRIKDASKRAAVASEHLKELQVALTELKSIRKEAVEELLSQGWTYLELAELLGVSRSRAYQIAQGFSGSTAKHYE
jgi:DNA-directed RNA polymerase specialized sigma24 family protein